MKKRAKSSKIIFLLICMGILLVSFTACAKEEAADTGKEAGTETTDTGTTATDSEDVFSGELKILGPHLIAEVGQDGVTDPVSGLFRPGYNVIINRFKELHPDVELQIEAIPWDSWQAKLQTAAAGNMVDVMSHGASILDIVEDLTPYIGNSPELEGALGVNAAIRYSDPNDYTKAVPLGMTITISPAVLMLDTQLFEDFGVEIPDAETFTYEKLLEIAEQLTGINPRTGEQSYGIYPYKSGDADIWKIFMNYNWAKGINPFTLAPDKFESTINFTSEEAIASFTYLNDLYQFAPESFIEGLGAELVGTADNNIAIYMNEGFTGEYKETVANGIEDRYLYIPLPKTDDGTSYSSHTGDWNLAIAKSSENKELAWEFIKFMLTDEVVQDWLIEIDAIPNNLAGMEKLKEVKPVIYDVSQKIAEVYPKDFFYASNNYWDNNFGTSNSVLSTNLTEMYAGRITPAECAQNVQDELEEYVELNK